MKYKIQGQKGILIQLEPYPTEDTVTESGIVIPKFNLHESDGGRLATSLDKEVYSTLGTVLQISAKAKQDLEEQLMDVTVGDTVVIQEGAKNPHNWFLDPTLKVQDFTGQLLVTASSIQAKADET